MSFKDNRISIFGIVPDDAELIAVDEEEDDDDVSELSGIELITSKEARRINEKWQKCTKPALN
jgi:hypothetical protein